MNKGHSMRLALILGGLALAVTTSVGCSGSDTTNPGEGTTGTGGSIQQGGGGAGGGTGATGGMGGMTGSGGMGGSGGSGGSGGASGPHGPAATALVNGGSVSSSSNFAMVHTLGQSSQAQQTLTSSNYQLQGGLVGANGTLP